MGCLLRVPFPPSTERYLLFRSCQEQTYTWLHGFYCPVSSHFLLPSPFSLLPSSPLLLPLRLPNIVPIRQQRWTTRISEHDWWLCETFAFRAVQGREAAAVQAAMSFYNAPLSMCISSIDIGKNAKRKTQEVDCVQALCLVA